MRGDLLTGIISAIFSVLYLLQTYNIKIFGGTEAIVDARTVPKIWGIGLLILSILLIFRSIYKIFKTKKAVNNDRNRYIINKIKEQREVVYTFILLILYAAFMDFLGFILASIIYVFLQIWTLTPLDKRNAKMKITSGILALTFSFGLYYIFTEYFMVLLPSGILSF